VLPTFAQCNSSQNWGWHIRLDCVVATSADVKFRLVIHSYSEILDAFSANQKAAIQDFQNMCYRQDDQRNAVPYAH